MPDPSVPTKKGRVALVLSSGGCRGYAHIGAIEALLESGYEITSIAGSSMGALIGGIYASGRLPEVKRWFCSLTRRDVISLIDISLGINHLVKGDRVMNRLKAIVPDVPIERLPIPFCAVATDVKTDSPVIFRSGSLFEAIRASISMPTLFRPVEHGDLYLIDGAISNGLPLDCVERTAGDLLVACNVSAPSRTLRRSAPEATSQSTSLVGWFIRPDFAEVNLVSLIADSLHILIQKNISLQLQLTPPDMLMELPMNSYNFNYDRCATISERGHRLMLQAIRRFEKQQPPVAPPAGDVSCKEQQSP